MLSLAAFFAPDDIPEELFRQPSQSYPPNLTDLVNNSDAMDEAIGALANLSLIDFDTARRSFSVHRLVQAAARDALATEAAAWADAALNTLVATFPEPGSKMWPLCERLVSHVRAVAAQVTTDSHALAWLLGTAADYLQERAAVAEVLPLYERTLAIFERLAASDPGNASWQHDVALSLMRVGLIAAQNEDHAGALAAWRRGLGIMQRLVTLAPDNAAFQRSRAWFEARIAELGDAGPHPDPLPHVGEGGTRAAGG